MAHEHAGPQPKAPWTKIFTAFKVALDIKKLLLAAAGILMTCVGWWILGGLFHNIRTFPEWKDFDNSKVTDPDERKALWNDFKTRRASWNLLHALAGAPSDQRIEDAADATNDLDEFLLLEKWEEAYRRLSERIIVSSNEKETYLEVPGLGLNQKFKITPNGEDAAAEFSKIRGKSLTVGALDFKDTDKKIMAIDGVLVNVEEDKFDKLKKYREGALDFKQIKEQAGKSANAALALKTFETRLLQPKIKPSGKLRTWPWFEYRGANPYLIVTRKIKTDEDPTVVESSLLNWIFAEQAPVLLEPIYKFLVPLVYLFHPDARWWDRLYLITVMVWALAVWGFFGGAICRIAAVQVARNERITVKEAILFARERLLSYVVAPIFPLGLLAALTVCLWFFGWLELIPYFGDLFAGLAWPIVLFIGFIMAVVVVGLVGWPLMNATISTEGSDSFDALSRSYSYVYQAPWQYLWFSFLAVVYGAALVFFVGFMASLMVFLGKWGVSSTPGLAALDREPSYLFAYAPTSFGWRDLLISDEVKVKPAAMSHKIAPPEFKEEYRKSITGFNRFGAGLVAIWIYLFFLLVVGFGYSYFWSASTIIYFLMRNSVDDTPMDEVHQEDEGLDDPFMKPTPPAPATPVPAQQSKPGMLSLNVIEGPPSAPTPPSAPAASAPTTPTAAIAPAGVVSELMSPTLASSSEDHPPPTGNT